MEAIDREFPDQVDRIATAITGANAKLLGDRAVQEITQKALDGSTDIGL